MTQDRCFNNLSIIKMSSKFQRSVKLLKMYFTELMRERERDPVQSSLPLMNLLSTKSELVLCRVTGNNGPVHHSSQQSLICFVIHGELEYARLRLYLPILPHPQHAQKQRKSEHPHSRGCSCLKSDVCSDFLLNCVFCDWADWAVSPVRVHLWGDAAKSQRLHWKPGTEISIWNQICKNILW